MLHSPENQMSCYTPFSLTSLTCLEWLATFLCAQHGGFGEVGLFTLTTTLGSTSCDHLSGATIFSKY